EPTWQPALAGGSKGYLQGTRSQAPARLPFQRSGGHRLEPHPSSSEGCSPAQSWPSQATRSKGLDSRRNWLRRGGAFLGWRILSSFAVRGRADGFRPAKLPRTVASAATEEALRPSLHGGDHLWTRLSGDPSGYVPRCAAFIL